MGLKERIESLRETTPKRCSHVYNSGIQDAAQLAAEADELMSRMGAALAVVEPSQLNEHQRKEVSRALREYNQYKDQTND